MDIVTPHLLLGALVHQGQLEGVHRDNAGGPGGGHEPRDRQTRPEDRALEDRDVVRADQLVIDGGYGKLKGKTFRISNMGDETDATIATLIAALDDSFAEQGM